MSIRSQRIRDKLRHAFRVTPAEPLAEEDLELLRRVADQICRRGMGAPAILALESMRPLNFLGSQAMVALKPFVEVLVSSGDYERFTLLLERRDAVPALIACIEQQESKKTDAG